MTTLTITPGTTPKTATVAGVVATHEAVQVTLAGLGSRVAEGLLLRILDPAGRRLASCQQWTAGGTNNADAIGLLDLNTREVVGHLEGVRQRMSRATGLVVWSLLARELIVDASLSVRANHTFDSEGEPTVAMELDVIAPVDLGWTVADGAALRSADPEPTYGDLVKAFRTLVADLKARRVI